jgi:hypothetical protein
LRDQRLAAVEASLADCMEALAEPATALALLMLSIGVEALPIALEALDSDELAELDVLSVVDVVLLTSSFLVQPPSANWEVSATARVRDSESERIMADSSWM